MEHMVAVDPLSFLQCLDEEQANLKHISVDVNILQVMQV